MKCLSILAAILCFAAPLTAKSRLETLTLHSQLLNADKSCTVYLPDGYDCDTTRSYPILYLLHGASDTHTAWTEKGNMRQIADEAFAAGLAHPMVIVMPDASGEGENHTGLHMGYFDVPGWPYERFFFEEFMPQIESRYRILADKQHRAIAGLSMGGGGTAAYALRHPELFGSACSMSGLLDLFPSPRNYDNDFQRSVVENSPVAQLRAMTDQEVEQARTIRWWVDCGDDDFLWKSNVAFYTLMRERNIPVQYRMRDGGHTWRYWQQVLADILTFFSIGFDE
ncbi:alpha/beta hydrolase [Alistipes megaguti]|uniref:alpha/beta hydrolase n=1 Tax=Alistipes megaguti TaxID=2364787 RepID=UPI000EFA61B5|nr:alpha/beta hydrolase family protein [Alistipes megaguti]